MLAYGSPMEPSDIARARLWLLFHPVGGSARLERVRSASAAASPDPSFLLGLAERPSAAGHAHERDMNRIGYVAPAYIRRDLTDYELTVIRLWRYPGTGNAHYDMSTFPAR